MGTPTTKEQIAEWHALFQSLADLTAGADDMAEIARRYLDNPCLYDADADVDPFWNTCNLQNPVDEFIDLLGEQFFDPHIHGDWSEKEQAELGAPKGGH